VGLVWGLGWVRVRSESFCHGSVFSVGLIIKEGTGGVSMGGRVKFGCGACIILCMGFSVKVNSKSIARSGGRSVRPVRLL
jgi:hypothetical protein